MRVLAFDVGISTGIVVADFEQARATPVLNRSWTIEYENDRNSSYFEGLEENLKTIYPDYVLIEYPFLTRLNDRATLIATLRGRWSSWLGMFFDYMEPKQIRAVTPAEWKPMPSSKVDLYKLPENLIWNSYKPTQHERDASSMVNWFSFWGLGKIG